MAAGPSVLLLGLMVNKMYLVFVRIIFKGNDGLGMGYDKFFGFEITGLVIGFVPRVNKS